MFAFDRWANQRLLDAAKDLSDEEFKRDLGASFGSVHGTFVHIIWGAYRWLRLWQQGSIPAAESTEEFPDVAALQSFVAVFENERDVFAAALTDQRLQNRVSVREREYALWELIQHVLNHSTYHRGQVVLLLRLLGRKPPATDFRLYLNE